MHIEYCILVIQYCKITYWMQESMGCLPFIPAYLLRQEARTRYKHWFKPTYSKVNFQQNVQHKFRLKSFHLNRKRYNIDGTDGEDMGWSFCCTPCVQVCFFLGHILSFILSFTLSFILSFTLTFFHSLFYPLFIPCFILQSSTILSLGLILSVIGRPAMIGQLFCWWNNSDDCLFNACILFPLSFIGLIIDGIILMIVSSVPVSYFRYPWVG